MEEEDEGHAMTHTGGQRAVVGFGEDEGNDEAVILWGRQREHNVERRRANSTAVEA